MHPDPALRRQINPQLEPGEWVLWTGKPDPFRLLRQDGETLIVGLLALLLTISLFLVYPQTQIFSFHLIGLGFSPAWVELFFGAITLFCIGRPLYLYWAATQTIYAVTQRRAFAVKPTRKGRIVQSYTNIERITRRDLAGGKGDLIFGTQKIVRYAPYGGMRMRVREIGFFGIERVREVEALMLKTFFSGTADDDSL